MAEVMSIGFYPGAKPFGQNLPCKLTFGEETRKPFTSALKPGHDC